MKRHWMPLYIADYLAGTSHLTTVEHGGYLLLLMHYWIKGEPPESDDIARRVTRMTNRQWAKSSSVLKSLFGDGWRHEVLDIELAKVIEKSASASANARRSHVDRKQKEARPQHTDTHHTQNHIGSDAYRNDADLKSDSDEGNGDLERVIQAFLNAAGYSDRSQAPTGWYHVAERAALWIRSGYPASMIVQETRMIAAKSGGPKPLAYFEKVFATAFARLSQPLPLVSTPQPEKADVRSRPRGRELQDAIDAQITRAREFSDTGAGTTGSEAVTRPIHKGQG